MFCALRSIHDTTRSMELGWGEGRGGSWVLRLYDMVIVNIIINILVHIHIDCYLINLSPIMHHTQYK